LQARGDHRPLLFERRELPLRGGDPSGLDRQLDGALDHPDCPVVTLTSVLRITVWNNSDLNVDTMHVQDDGNVSLPLIGEVPAADDRSATARPISSRPTPSTQRRRVSLSSSSSDSNRHNSHLWTLQTFSRARLSVASGPSRPRLMLLNNGRSIGPSPAARHRAACCAARSTTRAGSASSTPCSRRANSLP